MDKRQKGNSTDSQYAQNLEKKSRDLNQEQNEQLRQIAKMSAQETEKMAEINVKLAEQEVKLSQADKNLDKVERNVQKGNWMARKMGSTWRMFASLFTSSKPPKFKSKQKESFPEAERHREESALHSATVTAECAQSQREIERIEQDKKEDEKTDLYLDEILKNTQKMKKEAELMGERIHEQNKGLENFERKLDKNKSDMKKLTKRIDDL